MCATERFDRFEYPNKSEIKMFSLMTFITFFFTFDSIERRQTKKNEQRYSLLFICFGVCDLSLCSIKNTSTIQCLVVSFFALRSSAMSEFGVQFNIMLHTLTICREFSQTLIRIRFIVVVCSEKAEKKHYRHRVTSKHDVW